MSFVLGVRDVPRGEIELIRSIVRLSSDLLSNWTISESHPCDVLLVEGGGSDLSMQSPSHPFVIVPIVPRRESLGTDGVVLCRPIYAEELVELLNNVTASARHASAPTTTADDRRKEAAILQRWPSLQTLLQRAVYLKLATVMTRGAQSAASLSVLTGVDEVDCAGFLDILDSEHLITWQQAPPAEADSSNRFLETQPGDAIPLGLNKGLLFRIRRRLGLV